MDLFRKQFTGKLTWYFLAGITIAHIIAIFARDTTFALPVLVILGIATFILTLKSLPQGLFVAFAEIFVGGHGHLIEVEVFGFSMSLRMVIFASVMLAWLILFIKKDAELRILALREMPWLILIAALIIGTVVGFINNDPAKVFDDMNGYLAIGYLLPILSIRWTSSTKRDLLQVLFAGAVWLVFFTLLLSFLFNHLDGKTLSHVYTFVRDARLAEITLQTASDTSELSILQNQYWYRIFMQSQLFVVTMILLIFSAMVMMWRNQRLPGLPAASFALLGSTLILSMSRSFAFGLIAAGLLLIIVAFFQGKKPVSNVIKRLILSIVLGTIALLIAVGSALIPIPAKPDISDASFYRTSTDIDRELSISSRWQLLPAMMEQIQRSPIIGSGFGTEVTFISDDPRVRAINPSGEWTTYRFEWGYQDIWLKTGVLGLIAFGWYAILIFIAVRFTMKRHGNAWLSAGLGAGVLALFIINIFTPFLNHPIGIISMLFVLPFLDFEGLTKKFQESRAKARRFSAVKEMSPAMSVDEKA